MTQLIIQSLHLEQFQKFDSKTIEFGKETEIYGDNGTGKTTIYSALTWLLFGKDSLGREKFDIKRLVNGKKQDKVDVLVSGAFELRDGSAVKRFTLKRILAEKWDAKTDTYKGDETKCYVNEVPKLVNEYQTFIDSIISENDFRILTSSTYFLSMPMDKQREYLCQMAGVRDARAIAQDNPIWMNILKDMPEDVSIDDFTKSKKDSLKSFKDDKKGIQPSINALAQTRPEEQDWDALEQKLASVRGEIESINDTISSKESAYTEVITKRAQLRSAINSIDGQLMTIEMEQKKKVTEIRKKIADENAQGSKGTRELEDSLRITKMELSSKELAAESKKAQIKRLDDELTEKYNLYMAEQEKKFPEPQSSYICPLSKLACKSPELSEAMEKKTDELRTSFNESKLRTLDAIKVEGSAKRKEKVAAEAELEEIEASILEFKTNISRIENSLAAAPKFAAKAVEGSDEELAVIAEYQASHRAVEDTIKPLQDELDSIVLPNNDDLKAQRAEKMAEQEAIIKELSKRDQIAAVNKQIEAVTQKGKDISQQIAILENEIDALTEIRRAVVADATVRINAMFQVTHWVTSVQQKNGDYKDVCIPTIDGVSASLNSASQVNVGLDICYAISRFLGVSVFIWIDNRESTNKIIDLGETQIINLRVAAPGTPLSITTK